MPSIPIYALSSKGENLSTLGSTFTYRFKTHLQIPNDVECTLSLNQASLWYVQPNISIALGNNTMKFSCSFKAAENSGTTNDGNVYVVASNVDSASGEFTLTFEDGIYSLPALQATLKGKLSAVPSDLTGDKITLFTDNAQQKKIKCKSDGIYR